MVNLTFGEQVKIVLGRKGMTIKELAKRVEQSTGKKMSRQNMTQRLGRDNFQEQDMRLIAEILGCSFHLSIMDQIDDVEGVQQVLQLDELVKREVKVGTVKRLQEEQHAQERKLGDDPSETKEKEQEQAALMSGEKKKAETHTEERREETAVPLPHGRAQKEEKAEGHVRTGGERQEILGEINPYTGREYQTNSVRMHPKRIGFVQVYDGAKHQWTEMTEWAFLGEQERKKMLLGKEYEPPIYLD